MITLGTFFVAGEEIAWAQHSFGWHTPETLEAVSVQQETTLHNISSAHAFFVYAILFAGLYGTVVSILNARWGNKKQLSLIRSFLVPSLCLVPAFFMRFGYRFSRLALGVDHMFPQLLFQITKFSEVTELCLYFGLVMFAWLNLRQLPVTVPSSVSPLVSENKLHP